MCVCVSVVCGVMFHPTHVTKLTASAVVMCSMTTFEKCGSVQKMRGGGVANALVQQYACA